MRYPRTSAMSLAVSVFALLSISMSSAAAQWPPEELTNLEVLPEDTEVREMINIMRGFALGLGVRCQYCHVGEPGQPLSTFDFASDEKETKQKARVMLKMVQQINGEHLTGLPARREPNVKVTCATCHRGLSRPRMLEDVITEVVLEDGPEAGVQKYRKLREEYYGSFSYDFGELTLIQAAQALGQKERFTEAKRILQLNLEYFPKSVISHIGMGDTLAALGDVEGARVSYQKALELRPNNPAVLRRLQRLDEQG